MKILLLPSPNGAVFEFEHPVIIYTFLPTQAYVVMAYKVMAYTVMAYIVMAYKIMAYVAMTISAITT